MSAPRPTERIREGFRHLAEGRYEHAEREAQAGLAEFPEDPLAWHLMGAVRLKQGRAREAVERLMGAVRGAPRSAPAQLDLGNAWLAVGDTASAEAAFRAATELRPDWPAARDNLGRVLAHAGRDLEAVREFARAAAAGTREYGAMQACVDAIARHVRRGGPVPEPPPAERRAAPFTVVFCSPNEARLEAARARLEESLAGTGSDLVPILAPRSLASAYNAAARAARHDRIAFIHDDVALLSDAPWEVLAAALDHVDVVGLAGSERATGPAVLWSGHPHLHGWISYPAADGIAVEAAPLSLRCGLVRGIQALDGVLIAARTKAALAVGFDERTFGGFHFYDLDFSVRAHEDGFSLAVTTDVLALHASRGGFGEAWKADRDHFVAKYPALSAPAGDPHWYAATLGDIDQLRDFHAALASLAREAR